MNNLQPVTPEFDVELIRNQFPIFHNQPELHFLDSASTAQIPEAVITAMVDHEVNCRANVQRGAYSLADNATRAFEAARQTVATYLNAKSAREVVFTSGTTAALNFLAHCLSHQLQPGDEILLSELEHHSNILPWRVIAEKTGAIIRYLPIDPDGRLDLFALPWKLSRKTRIISLTHCSNVTGAITNVKTVVDAAKQVGALVILDGAQSAPHGPLDVQALGIDFYAFSSHKCYGPNGAGVLWGRYELLDKLPPYQTGGGMISSVEPESHSYAEVPHRFEAGTPPIAQCIGLAAALNWCMQLPWHEIHQYEQALLDYLIQELNKRPQVHILSPVNGANRQPLLSLHIRGIHAHDLSHILNEHHVAVRGGAHCAELLMRALGYDAAIRISIAPYNNYQDIDVFLMGLDEAIRILL